MRLVKTAAAKDRPCTRLSASACELTSMTQDSRPWRTIILKNSARSGASGVVRQAGTWLPPQS